MKNWLFLVTADGSEDSKTNPEGLGNYVVPPTLPTALTEQPQSCPVPEDFSQTKQPLCMAYEKSEDNKVQENDERIDDEFDRIYNHSLKNRKLKISY